MKVLHVLNELRPSGAETMLRSAAPFWQQHAVFCDIVATSREIGPYASVLVEAGYKVHHLPNVRSPSFLSRFIALVRSGKYDIVHQHAERMSFWFGLASMWAGACVVRTVHSNFAFEGGLKIRRGLQRRLLNALGARFVAIGDSVQENEAQRFGLECTQVRNWADLKRLDIPTPEQRRAARAHWGFADDDFVVITLGNCAVVKNHGALLHALAQCTELRQIRYLHVGVEDAGQSERRLVRELDLESRVVFAGWLDDPSLALYAADIYAMPSLYEGLGIAAVEALSVGLPAILSEVSGLLDLRAHFPGLIYAPAHADGFATALRTAVSIAGVQRDRCVQEYRSSALKYYSAERGVAEYAATYASILGRELQQVST